MRPAPLLLAILLLAIAATSSSAALPMRPYSGIGVLRVTQTSLMDDLHLYEEPGLMRSGTLKPPAVQQLTAWLFGPGDDLYLLVTARKGDWLRVERDDAGREAWLQTPRRGSYSPWEQFLKGKTITFLRNAPKKQLQLYAQPGAAPISPLNGGNAMKVIMVQGDWSYVLFDNTSAGWIRWRDHDGRLLVGLATAIPPESR